VLSVSSVVESGVLFMAIINHQSSIIDSSDDVVFFSGRLRADCNGSQVAICRSGGIYIGGALARCIPRGATHLKIGWGPKSRRLVLEPVSGKVSGAVALDRKSVV
jgi:hypothetical protein